MGFTAPSYFENGKPVLKQSVVLYLDTLGSRDMAETPDPRPELEKLYGAVEDAARNGLTQANSKFPLYSWTAFTDHIAVGWPIKDDAEFELGNALDDAANYQYVLARRGILARGGLTIGKAFVADGFAFGPALVEAYQIESKVASYPRIVLAKKVLPYVKKHVAYFGDPLWSPYEQWLLRDQDGNTFINYLSAIDPNEEEEDEYGDSAQEMRLHKQMVEQGLKKYARRPNILDKFEWVASLHNHWCGRVFSDDEELPVLFPPRGRKMIRTIPRRRKAT